jgi:Skp family chaperone for outer membrane proteins
MKANRVLSGSQMDALSPEMRQIVEQGRQSSAMLNGLTQSAYQNTSQRFSALQQLINRIATAQDPKAIQDLQARIQAEQNMLTNEQTKLQSLYQVAQSEELMRKQRIREQSASDIGSMRSLPTVDY